MTTDNGETLEARSSYAEPGGDTELPSAKSRQNAREARPAPKETFLAVNDTGSKEND